MCEINKASGVREGDSRELLHMVVRRPVMRLVPRNCDLAAKFNAAAALLNQDSDHLTVEFEHDGETIIARRGFSGEELYKNYLIARAGSHCGRTLDDLDAAAFRAAGKLGW